MVNKKAISPVVATALLLVVAVVAVVGFQTWFNTYQSGLNTKVEQQSATGSPVTVERLENDTVYLKNIGNEDLLTSQIKVTDSAGNPCAGTASVTINKSVTAGYTFDNSGCTLTKGTSADVVVVTKSGVYSANVLVR